MECLMISRCTPGNRKNEPETTSLFSEKTAQMRKAAEKEIPLGQACVAPGSATSASHFHVLACLPLHSRIFSFRDDEKSSKL